MSATGHLKKYLLIIAALTLSGCAYSEYRAGYLADFAGYDCTALESEMTRVPGKTESGVLAKNWYRDNGHAVNNAGRSVVVSNKVLSTGGDSPVGAPPSPLQKIRMQSHARQQAILQLQQNRGCGSGETATGT